MRITEKFIPHNPFSRPGGIRPETLGVVVHWVGNAGTSADANARYFELLAKQDEHDDKRDRYASAHAIVGLDGEIVQTLPWDEVAYHVGAYRYTDLMKRRFPTYATNKGQHSTPNWCMVGIEMCHPDTSGEFTKETLEATELLCHFLLRRYNLYINSLFRHYCVTEKRCPLWFVANHEAWATFRRRVDDLFLLEE